MDDEHQDRLWNANIRSIDERPPSGDGEQTQRLPTFAEIASMGINIPEFRYEADGLFGALPPPMEQPPVTSTAPQPILNDALSYLDLIKVRFYDNPEVYNAFLDIMKDFKSTLIDAATVIDRVTFLFDGHRDLIERFNPFLPSGYRVEWYSESESNYIRVTTPMGITVKPFDVESVGVAHLDQLFVTNTLPPLTNNGSGLAQLSPFATSSSDLVGLVLDESRGLRGATTPDDTTAFNSALAFVNRVKYRFQHFPAVYQQFLDILKASQRQKMGLHDVRAEVSTLFESAPDLLKEFDLFIADALRVNASARAAGQFSSATAISHMPRPAAQSLAGASLSAGDSGYASLPIKRKDNIQRGHKDQNVDTSKRDLLAREEHETTDTGSVYTMDPEAPPPAKNAYISLLADDLLSKSLLGWPDEETLDKVCEALPRLLKTFAAKVGSTDSMQIYRDVMVFVRRYRSEIARVMKDRYLEEQSNRSDVLGETAGQMDIEDIIRNWNIDNDALPDPNAASNEQPDDTMDDSQDEDLDDIDPITEFLPECTVYRDFISKLPAYKWLLESVARASYMSAPGDAQTNIREAILDLLPKAQKISRKQAPQRHKLTIAASWDPVSFVHEQEYREPPQKALKRAITITGSTIDAQAATTTQFLNQTWPLSSKYFLNVVTQAMCNPQDTPYSETLPDGTQLTAWSHRSEFVLEIMGIAESVAEFGEQFAWATSALRSSPYDIGVAIITPFVSRLWTVSSAEISNTSTKTFFCNIDFNFDVVEEAAGEYGLFNGQCWHRLFRNPVIVGGYSIPRRRSTEDRGLEISLDTMATLTDTHHVDIFQNKIFIKGFSTMLVPVLHTHNIILWHLVQNRSGDRISYLDSKDFHAAGVKLSDLEAARHILGWCSTARCLAGSADANYAVQRSWLGGVPEHSKMKDMSICQRRLIQSDHVAAIGKKDLSLKIHRGNRAKLQALSKKYFLLWDVGCKRGWLLNGTTTLLHLLRSSLEYNKTDDQSFAFLFKPENFQEGESPSAIAAAMEALMNPANLDIELYEDDELGESSASGKFRIRDRVNELYGALEKIIEYQGTIPGDQGDDLKQSPRKDLEGWDFKDIATNEDPIYPRLGKLKTIGKGWVDLTRALQAVVLFGRDFGELIGPTSKNELCARWQTLPSHSYCLAVTMEDLSRVMDRFGHPRANPLRLTKSIVWQPHRIRECDCSANKEKHCELAQAIWPLHMSKSLSKATPVPLTNIGAVAFGHNKDVGWVWHDNGDPERGEPPTSDEESDSDDPVDSGIGLSAYSSSIAGQRENSHSLADTLSRLHEDYKIAVICALSKELMAVRALFDDNHADLSQHEKDTNTYALGQIGNHNVVAACLPFAEYGTNAAAKVASDMEKSFPSVKWYFVVGIGGGIPSKEHDIRLGDVVVSNGVVQHDLGKTMQKASKFLRSALTQRPARSLMTAISLIQSDPSLSHNALDEHVQRIVSLRPEYASPGESLDKLFDAYARHEEGQDTCVNCDGPQVPKRVRAPGPHVHYGLIASGNQVIKDAIARDRIGSEMNALCVEMECAGVMTTGDCLVIRGICDYADSHKNDDWHNYAAATAAAYTKFFVLRLRNVDLLSREVVNIHKRQYSATQAEGDGLRKKFRYDCV